MEEQYMVCNIISSPLQGFTDFRFRNGFDKFFGGVDAFYAPYIRLHGNTAIKSSYQRDILPENNRVGELIPQIMTNSAEEFLYVAGYVQSLGYKELNWNLGCPYPMVTKRGLGSGLLHDSEKVDSILKRVTSESDILISIKMRLGYESKREILNLLPVLENHKIKNLVIHPRIGKQLYKGEADLESFQQCIENTSHKVYYNGDINSVGKFREMRQRFPTIENWAVGRGLIANPFLASMIKNDTDHRPFNWVDIFSDFHDALFRAYDESLSGSKHTLLKMQSFWEYFAQMFDNPHKAYKGVKKAQSIKAYHDAVRLILKSGME